MVEKKLPLYLKEVYGDFYNKAKLSAWFDKNWMQSLLTLGNNKTLTNALLKEIYPSCKVLQLGCTFGRQMLETAAKIGTYGIYDVLDISNIQLKRCKEITARTLAKIVKSSGAAPIRNAWPTLKDIPITGNEEQPLVDFIH